MAMQPDQPAGQRVLDATREERIRRFTEEHRDAIEAHNRFIVEHGIWSEKYRSW
jgi:post-segregation antitoxin (ccd killing protein)